MPHLFNIHQVSCFAYEGIEAVKEALGEGKKCSTDALPIKVNKSTYYFVFVLII